MVRLEGVPIDQAVASCQWIAEGVRVSEVISSSSGTAAIEQATSKYQAFEGACILNAPTWHQ